MGSEAGAARDHDAPRRGAVAIAGNGSAPVQADTRQSSDAFERISNDRELQLALMVDRRVLEIASATTVGHVGTDRRHPTRTRTHHRAHRGTGETWPFVDQLNVDDVTRQPTSNEHDPTRWLASHTVATLRDADDLELGHVRRLLPTYCRPSGAALDPKRGGGGDRVAANRLTEDVLVSAPHRPIEIAPSILPADFSRLGAELQMLEKARADRIHWDVMDGVFVPNLTVGPDVVKSCRQLVDICFEAHLMVENPDLLAPLYIDAGCELVTVHAESTRHLDRTLGAIKDLGARAAVTLNPSTPLEAIDNVLYLVDMVLIMTVNPGFGGQSYIADQERKVRRLRAELVDRSLDVDIEVDGGIKPATIASATEAGANVFVAGSAVFADPEGPEHAIATLRGLAEAAR